MKNISISKISYVSFLALALFVGTQVAYGAWTAPTAAAPDGNAPAPLNVSGTAQTKLGGLIVGTGNPTNGLIVQGGNVGIGTVSPFTKLDVVGSVRAQGLTVKSSDPNFNAASLVLDAGDSPGSKYSLSADEDYTGNFTFKDVNLNRSVFRVQRNSTHNTLEVDAELSSNKTLWVFENMFFIGKRTGASHMLWMREAEGENGGIMLNTYETNNSVAIGQENGGSGYLWLNPWGGGGTDEFESPNNGRVAIGFGGAPKFALDVAGTIRATGSVRADTTISAKHFRLFATDITSAAAYLNMTPWTASVANIPFSGWNIWIASTNAGIYKDLGITARNNIILKPGEQGTGDLYIPIPSAGVNKVLTAQGTTGKALWVTAPASDARLKTNVAPIKSALDKVKKLSGVTFNWKESGEKSIGLIAQEVENVVPEVVHDEDNGYKSVEYDKLVGLLIEAIKEQDAKIDALTKQVEALKAR